MTGIYMLTTEYKQPEGGNSHVVSEKYLASF
jgi:hypothetical protein